MSIPYRLVLISLFLAIAGFILSPFSFFQTARGGAQIIIKPFKNGSDFLFQNLYDFVVGIFWARQMMGENQKLQEKILNLQSQLQKLQEKETENELLKKELGFLQGRQEEFLPAQVLSYISSGGEQLIWLDQGEKNQVQKGQVVLSQGYLVGKITTTTPEASQVTLLTSPSLLVPVQLVKTNALGLLKGTLAGLQVEDVPTTQVVTIGEAVTTSSLGGDYPAGLAIGSVKKILSSPSELFQKMLVESPLNFSNLKFVLIKIK